MGKNINPTNARTQSIELAVAELSSRASITMTDVREFMDDLVSQKIPTGRKLKYTDPNGDEVEYEERKPISNFYNYIRDEKEILTKAREGWLNNDSLVLVPAKGSTKKISEWLKSLKAVSWTIRADCIPSFIEAVYNIADYTQNGTKHQENIYLHSAVEGNGKSTLKNRLLDAFKQSGAKVSTGYWPTGQYTDTTVFSKNAVVGIDDTSWDTVKNINEDQLKAILRRENEATLSCNVKYQPTMQIKPRATLIACGNTKPPRADDRTWRIIETNAITVEDAKDLESLSNALTASLNRELIVIQADTQISKDLRLILQKLSVKSIDNSERGSSGSALEVEKSKVSIVVELLEILQKYRTSEIDFSKMNLRTLLFEYEPEAKRRLATKLTKALKYLASKRIIKTVTYGDDLYAKWDVTNILDWDIDGLIAADTVALDGEGEVLKTLEEWDRIIKLAEDYENDPENKFLKGDADAHLDDSWNVCTRFDKAGEYNKNGDQVCVNKPLEPGKQTRKNDEVHQQNYLFECDDIPVKEQVEMIENAPQELKDSLYWVCSTGGKSVHAIVKTNTPDSATSELRKYIHTKLNEKYFNGKADPSGCNAGRLARAPNAIRQDDKHPGKKQICLYFNHEEPKAINVDKLVEDFEEETRLRKSANELQRGFEANTITSEAAPRNSEGVEICTLEQLEEWNKDKPSKAKEECIKFLKGQLEDWNRGIACVRELRNFGFSDYDILAEAYDSNDKWIKSAIKALK